ncbi:hypothetical protein JX266_007670 [Neoarthrinium moseri]|nr:hypothetical protein JX266_007670 [Neoarthrinium moseri]
MASPGDYGRSLSTEIPFIVTSNIERADPATRKLIRSHVMRGKRSKKALSHKARDASSMGAITGRINAARVELGEVAEIYQAVAPSHFGSDVSFLTLADSIEPSALLSLTKVSPIATKIISPLIAAIGYQPEKQGWLHIIGSDAAALHISVFAVEEFIEKVLRRHMYTENLTSMLHFQKGLEILQERLSGPDDQIKISDSTIGVVVKLATAAHFNGDYRTSKQHMEAIRKMVDLRGGITALKGKSMFTEILKCDIAIALLNASMPFIFSQSSEPVIPYPQKLLPASDAILDAHNNDEPFQDVDSGLATAWRVMKNFCFLVNLGAEVQRPIRLEIIHETMTAVMYRLLKKAFPFGSTNETLRQGLLAFSYHVFVQWQDIKSPYHEFRFTFKNCIESLKPESAASSQMMLWLLMTGALAVFDLSDETWVGEYWHESARRCQVETWNEVKIILKSFMWVALIDDEPGKRIYDTFNLRRGQI